MSGTIVIERFVAAGIDRVWRAWTDPDELAAWFWPDSFGTTCSIELAPGGRFRIASPEMDMAVAATCVEVDPPHRLLLTWAWEGEEETTAVEVVLTTVEGGTSLVIEHRRHASDEDAANHAQGWHDCLDRLGPFLAESSRTAS